MRRGSRLPKAPRGRTLLLLAAAAIPTACGPRRVASSPASVCASKATVDQIRAAVFQRAASDQFVHDRSAMPKLAAQSRLSVRYPLLDTYDRDTQKAACSAVLNVALPGGVLSAGGAPVLKSAIQYTSQPMADGSGVHFAMTGGDEVVSGIAEADTSRWAAANGEGPDSATASGRRLKIVTAAQTTTARAPAPRVFAPAPSPPLSVAQSSDTPPHQLRIVTEPSGRTAHSAAPVAEESRVRLAAAAREPRLRIVTEPPHRVPRPAAPVAGEPRIRIAAAAPAPEPKLRIITAAAGLAPRRVAPPESPGRTRVFVHIADPDQQGQAEALQARLHLLAVNGGPVSTPPVRLVRATPPRAEVRCLKAADCGAARRIAAYLGDMLPGGPPTVVDLHGRYQGDAAVRPGSLELWLPAAPDRLGPPEEDDTGPP